MAHFGEFPALSRHIFDSFPPRFCRFGLLLDHFSATISPVSRHVSGDFGLILVTSWATFRPHFRPSPALFLVIWGSFWRLLGALSGHFSAAISTVSRIVSGDFGLLLETSRTTVRAQFRPSPALLLQISGFFWRLLGPIFPTVSAVFRNVSANFAFAALAIPFCHKKEPRFDTRRFL